MSTEMAGRPRKTQSCMKDSLTEEKYLRSREKFTLKWSINPVPIVYPKNVFSKPSSLHTA